MRTARHRDLYPPQLQMQPIDEMKIAVIIPCRDEEKTIGGVVSGFRATLPEATIYVYDNNSQDATKNVALTAGALVRTESLQGKGNVVRRMFSDVEADVFVMVDGDATYDPASAPQMISMLVNQDLDMVVGKRLRGREVGAFPRGHQLGNRLLTGVVSWLFGKGLDDMLSGYRVFSRRFVKSFPALSRSFEIETELTVHALSLRLPVTEVPISYAPRPLGSVSKLRTYRDGVRILITIFNLCKAERPLFFFGVAGAILALSSLILAAPIILTFMTTGLVPRFPTTILSTGLMLLAFLSVTSGIILDSVAHGRREMKRLHYLTLRAARAAGTPRSKSLRSSASVENPRR
jgi:glycosyltransferase involved in cell wall biosynthesis